MAPPAFASGPMHVDHIPGRPIVLGLAGYEFACPGCAFDVGKASKEGKIQECYDIIYKGLHVENRKVFERPDIKPLSTPLTTYNTWAVVPGRSISIKSAPASGFNVVCPPASDNKGETEENKKRTTAVIGNEGVAGIKIKGEEIDIEIEAPPANPATKSTVTLISPIKADDVVVNNYGVAGIDLKGTGKVKLVIGKSTK